MKGKLIVIDGLDGSGKQTQTEKLYQRLKAQNIKVCKTSFPNYNSKTGELIKMYLSGEFGNVNEVNAYQGSLSYSLDRYLSFINDEWGKKYREGYVVLCDRYTTSNLIHQGTKVADNELVDYLNWIEDLEYNKMKLPIPDQVLFLDVPIDVSEKLMRNRLNKFTGEDKKDIHEANIEYLRKCYEVSQKICELKNWDIIKCTKDDDMLGIEEINDKIYQKVLEKIKV